MFNYIEIIHTKSGVVTHRIDVTGKSERSIERAEAGVNINLNHKEYHTDTKESETELEINPKVPDNL